MLNLPGNKEYDPKRPWVYTITKEGVIAADLFTYVDDQRCTGNTKAICWMALQRVAGCMSYLGLQSAARKRRKVGKDAGAWSGSIVDTTEGKIRIRTDQEKWDKTRVWIEKLNVLIYTIPRLSATVCTFTDTQNYDIIFQSYDTFGHE